MESAPSPVVVAAPTDADPIPARVVVYSEAAGVRDAIRTAVGRRPAPDLGRVEWVEAWTAEQVIGAVDGGGIDLCILDGEAWPAGGLGISRQLKNEIVDCPAIVVLVARRDDVWLASWSLADAVATHPIDPMALAATVIEVLRQRARRTPVVRAR